MGAEVPMKKLLVVAALLASAAHAQGVRGAMIVAYNGTFLGTCEGTVGAYSISNPYSKYGSEYSSTSIYNKYSRYGSEYSSYSPYNAYSSQTPYLIGYDSKLYQMFTDYSYEPSQAIQDALASSGLPRVSVNGYSNSIDPDALRGICRNP